MKLHEAIRMRQRIEGAAGYQTDEEALDCIDMYPKWRENLGVKVDDRYRHNNILYRCLQSHTTQEGWTPDQTPALWRVISLDEWPEWIQPTGSADAYMIGDKVSHNNKHWESTVDNNVWEPSVYGWEEK